MTTRSVLSARYSLHMPRQHDAVYPFSKELNAIGSELRYSSLAKLFAHVCASIAGLFVVLLAHVRRGTLRDEGPWQKINPTGTVRFVKSSSRLHY